MNTCMLVATHNDEPRTGARECDQYRDIDSVGDTVIDRAGAFIGTVIDNCSVGVEYGELLERWHHWIESLPGVGVGGLGPKRIYTINGGVPYVCNGIGEGGDKRPALLPTWLRDIVPAPFSPSMVGRTCATLAACIRPEVVRMPNLAGLKTSGGLATADYASREERLVRDEWSRRARLCDSMTGVRTGALVGSGVVGGLDGLITSPLIAYPQYDWHPMPIEIITAARVVSGKYAGEAIAIPRKSPMHRWWIDYQVTVRRVLYGLWYAKMTQESRYVDAVVAMVVDAYMSWGPMGWMSHELDSDGGVGSQYVDVEAAVRLVDHSIAQFAKDYIKLTLSTNRGMGGRSVGGGHE